MQRMRDILRDSLGRSLRELTDEDRLAAAWPVACGHALAEHGELLQLDGDRILHVRVDGSAWMQQFLHMRSALSNDLGRIAGVRLQAIQFHEAGTRRPQNLSSPPKPSAAPKPIKTRD
jgi:hypothetical protein